MNQLTSSVNNRACDYSTIEITTPTENINFENIVILGDSLSDIGNPLVSSPNYTIGNLEYILANNLKMADITDIFIDLFNDTLADNLSGLLGLVCGYEPIDETALMDWLTANATGGGDNDIGNISSWLNITFDAQQDLLSHMDNSVAEAATALHLFIDIFTTPEALSDLAHERVDGLFCFASYDLIFDLITPELAAYQPLMDTLRNFLDEISTYTLYPNGGAIDDANYTHNLADYMSEDMLSLPVYPMYATSPDEYLATVTLGDLNLDNTINVLDIILLVNHVVNDNHFSPLDDINTDSSINLQDVVSLVNLVINPADPVNIEIPTAASAIYNYAVAGASSLSFINNEGITELPSILESVVGLEGLGSSLDVEINLEIPFTGQVESFIDDNQDLQLNSQDTLYIIWIGANDAFATLDVIHNMIDQSTTSCTSAWQGDGDCDSGNNNLGCDYDGGDCCQQTCEDGTYTCGSSGYNCLDSDEADSIPNLLITDTTNELISHIDSAIQQLNIQAGATNFLILNIPDLGIAPVITELSSYPEISHYATQMANNFNQSMAAMTVSDQLNIKIYDIYYMFDNFLNNSDIQNLPAIEHFFVADDLHLTSEIHQLFTYNPYCGDASLGNGIVQTIIDNYLDEPLDAI